MIHQVGDVFVISSRELWLPGAYESERAARYAFRFPDAVLQKLQDEANKRLERVITFKDLQKQRHETP